jgi:hypothetical protein
VDLRWFDAAWPAGLQALGKLLLVDMGLYGFLAIRQLSGTGFDFYLKWSDLETGLRELILFVPVVLMNSLTGPLISVGWRRRTGMNPDGIENRFQSSKTRRGSGNISLIRASRRTKCPSSPDVNS